MYRICLLLLVAIGGAEKVYFTTNEGLHVMGVDGSGQELLAAYTSSGMCKDGDALAVDESLTTAVVVCSTSVFTVNWRQGNNWIDIDLGYSGNSYKGVDIDLDIHVAYVNVLLSAGWSVQPYSLQGCDWPQSACSQNPGCTWKSDKCSRYTGSEAALMRIGTRLDSGGSISIDADTKNVYATWVNANSLKSSISYQDPKGSQAYLTPIVTKEQLLDNFIITGIQAINGSLFVGFHTGSGTALYKYELDGSRILIHERLPLAGRSYDLGMGFYAMLSADEVIYAAGSSVLRQVLPCPSIPCATPPTEVFVPTITQGAVSTLYYKEAPPPPPTPTPTLTLGEEPTETVVITETVLPPQMPPAPDAASAPVNSPAADPIVTPPAPGADPAPRVPVPGAPFDVNSTQGSPVAVPAEEAASDNLMYIIIAGCAVCIVLLVGGLLCCRKKGSEKHTAKQFHMDELHDTTQEKSPYFLGFGDVKKTGNESVKGNPLDFLPHEDVHHDLNTTASHYEELHHVSHSDSPHAMTHSGGTFSNPATPITPASTVSVKRAVTRGHHSHSVHTPKGATPTHMTQFPRGSTNPGTPYSARSLHSNRQRGQTRVNHSGYNRQSVILS